MLIPASRTHQFPFYVRIKIADICSCEANDNSTDVVLKVLHRMNVDDK